jgi:hypothetical protein
VVDLFRTTYHTKTQHVTKSRGRHCGDIQMESYLTNVVGPVPLVLDLHIAHGRFGSSSDPNLTGHLHYPHDIDKSLNEDPVDTIRKYHTDYHNNPPSAVFFMPAIPSTSGRLHSEFIRLLFLQDHRETDRFFATSVFMLRFSCSPSNPVYTRSVDFSDLVFSLSSHRYSYIGLVFNSRFFYSPVSVNLVLVFRRVCMLTP